MGRTIIVAAIIMIPRALGIYNARTIFVRILPAQKIHVRTITGVQSLTIFAQTVSWTVTQRAVLDVEKNCAQRVLTVMEMEIRAWKAPTRRRPTMPRTNSRHTDRASCRHVAECSFHH